MSRFRKPCPGHARESGPCRLPVEQGFDLNLPADSVLDNVFGNVARRVVNAIGGDFGLFLDLGMMARRQSDNLAQELLIDSSQDFDGHEAEVIGRTVLEVQALQNGLENLVIDRQLRRDPVGGFVNAFFLLEVEQAGVVLLVGLAAQITHETGVNLRPFTQLQELPVGFKPPIFSHAKEHHSINRDLDGGIQIV